MFSLHKEAFLLALFVELLGQGARCCLRLNSASLKLAPFFESMPSSGQSQEFSGITVVSSSRLIRGDLFGSFNHYIKSWKEKCSAETWEIVPFEVVAVMNCADLCFRLCCILCYIVSVKS